MNRLFVFLAVGVGVLSVPSVASASSDPAGDVTPCPGIDVGVGGDAPDLIEAVGEVVELGTSVRWTLRFAEPLSVPDTEGSPFRVDVLVFDPDVETVSFGYYRGLNRMLRYDAVVNPVLTTLLLPERGESRFIPPTVDGDTITVRIPGRALSADEDESGTSPGLDRLRWGVIVRDEGDCDLLGEGRPTQRLLIVEPTPPTHSPPGQVKRAGYDRFGWWPLGAGAVIVAAAGGVLLVTVRRRREDPTRRP